MVIKRVFDDNIAAVKLSKVYGIDLLGLVVTQSATQAFENIAAGGSLTY